MHLLITARYGDPEWLFGANDRYSEYLLGMTFLSDMTPIAQPVVMDTPTGKTGMLILAESHISIHSMHEDCSAYIDLFTCKPLPCGNSDLVEYTLRFWKFKDIIVSQLSRGLETLG